MIIVKMTNQENLKLYTESVFSYSMNNTSIKILNKGLKKSILVKVALSKKLRSSVGRKIIFLFFFFFYSKSRMYLGKKNKQI